MTTPTNDRREVLAAVTQAIHDAECEAYVHEGRNAKCERSARAAMTALDAALAAQGGERGGAEVVAAVEAAMTPWHETVRDDILAALADSAGALAKIKAEVLRAAADEIGPFHGAVLVGPVGDAFCTGWDAALAAIRERADLIAGDRP